jgi:protein CpxP
MNLSGIQFTRVSTRFVSAVALAATLALAPMVVLAVDKDAHEDRVELRIKDLHAKLHITSAQEDQWSKVAQVMIDNAKVMDTLTQARADHAKDVTAVDDLQSYGEIADAHADGIKKLTPVFATLYAGMSDVQKKEADTLFREGDHKHGHKRSEGK